MTGIPKHMIEQAAHRPLRARRVDECDTLHELFTTVSLRLAAPSCAASIPSLTGRSAMGAR